MRVSYIKKGGESVPPRGGTEIKRVLSQGEDRGDNNRAMWNELTQSSISLEAELPGCITQQSYVMRGKVSH